MDRPLPILAVSALITDAAGAVLLVQRGRGPAQGLWSLPGGKVQHGELLAAAVRREIAEETGLQVRPGRLVSLVERIHEGGDSGPPRYHYVIACHRAQLSGAGSLRAGDDAQAVTWASRRELHEGLALTEGLGELIEAALGPAGEGLWS